MKNPPDDDFSKIDRAVFREHARMTAGSSAFHSLDPAEMVMRMEEAAADPGTLTQRERETLRAEVFSGFAEYLFADGPDPREVRRRIQGLFESFTPALLPKIKGPVEWIAPGEAEAILRRYAGKILAEREAAAGTSGHLGTWMRTLRAERDFDFIRSTIVALVELLLSQGRSWRLATSTAYCLAKALRPHLIAHMPLADIARLSGDLGGRATPTNRIKRLYNRRLEAAEAKGSYIWFQKSASAVAAMSAAQRGNSNRKRTARHRKPERKKSA